MAVAALSAYAQTPAVGTPERPAGAAKPATLRENTGVPPRAGPSDYAVQAKVGTVIIAADFDEHGIPTPDGALTSDSYVVVELAIFGPSGTRLPVSFSDFSLRINGKKNAVQAEPWERAGSSAKDPEWVSPQKQEKSSSTSFGGGGGNDTSTPPPGPPAELRRAWAKRVMRAALAEGEPPLPRAGLLYFPYGGKGSGIRSLQLIYSGAAGKATLDLMP
ncbi:MAG TPA: hypothetical protein VMA31_10910 [Bryobacteraceae bacterium]|nr:hypothetical protein [Bryobacteraceae bacterium]